MTPDRIRGMHYGGPVRPPQPLARVTEFLTHSLSAERDHYAARVTQITLSMMASGEATLLGKPVKVHLEWPDGLPGGFATREALQEWARRELIERFGYSFPDPREAP